MRQLCVEPIGRFAEVGSVASAIEASRKGELFQDVLALRPRITSVSFSEHSFVFGLSGGWSLEIRLDEQGMVHCHCMSVKEPVPPGGPASPMTLIFPGETRRRWDRGKWPARMLDHSLSSVFVNAPRLFVYVTGIPIIMYGGLRVVDTGDHLLYWDEV